MHPEEEYRLYNVPVIEDDKRIATALAIRLKAAGYEVPDTAIIDEYERKYTFRAEPGEGWYRVSPKRVLAWTEKGFPVEKKA